MRIVGYIDHPVMKITLFKMDNRLSVKFETGLYEQTYKFRVGPGIESPEDVKKIVTPEFQQQVLDLFAPMHKNKNEAVLRFMEDDEKGFEQII